MKGIKLLGIPFSFGQPHLGVEKAFDALSANGLLEELTKIAPVTELGELDFSLIQREDKTLFIHNRRSVSLANELISNCIQSENLQDFFLLNVGGDHGLALGTIHGLLAHDSKKVVIWADAHGDINSPETSPTGNFHGMPLSFLLDSARSSHGFRWLQRVLPAEKLIFFGPRDLDKDEAKLIKELSIQYYSSEIINYYGTEEILPFALKKADPHAESSLHLSFDVDLFDSCDVFATGTRVLDGPEVSEVMKLGLLLGETGRLRSMDLVEINPEVGTEEQVLDTLNLAMEFTTKTIESAFRQNKILQRSWSRLEQQIFLTA